jgi:hypothetical protein
VQYWVNRAGQTPLAQVDWEDRPHVAHQVANKTNPTLQRQVVALRQQLQQGELGFVGAQSIHEALAGVSGGLPRPSLRTIGPILQRQGLLDGGAPRSPRRSFPNSWHLDLQSRPHGQVIFLRRTDAQGRAQVLGQSWFVEAAWLGRLVRAEVDLDQNHIRFYRLRRNEPTQQPLFSVLP